VTNVLRARVFLLDLDGTLVDSTAAVARSWTRLADQLGIDPARIVGQFHGIPAAAALREVAPDLDEQSLRRATEDMLAFEISDTEGVTALPGAQQFVANLPERAWAVVTSCSFELARVRLAAAGLPMPKVLVTSDDLATGKPDPGPYLLGAERSGVEPADCVVVEDAPAGVASGLAAGCAVLGLATTHRSLEVPSVRDLSVVSVVPEDDEWWRLSWP
jgi:sugar-phosphatase